MVAKLKAALLSLVVAATAHGQWRIVFTNSEPGQDAVVHRRVSVQHRETGEQADVDLAIFPVKSCNLRIIDNPSGQTLAETMNRENFVAGVNGGYVDSDFAVFGLWIYNAKSTE